MRGTQMPEAEQNVLRRHFRSRLTVIQALEAGKLLPVGKQSMLNSFKEIFTKMKSSK